MSMIGLHRQAPCRKAPRTRRGDPRSRVPASTLHPGWIGIAFGVGAAYLVAGQLLRMMDLDLWRVAGLIVGHGLAFGAAGTALAVGRRAGTRWVMVLSLVALLADPVRLLVDGLPIPRGGTLLTVGSVSLSVLTVLLAVLAAGSAWAIRSRRVTEVVPIRPWLVGGLAAATVLSYGTGSGFDPDAWVGLGAYAAAVGLGTAAIPIGVYASRWRLTWLGWLAVAGLPVMHSAWFLDSPDPEAWSVFYLDVFGFGLSVIAGVLVAVALLRRGWSHEPWRGEPWRGSRRLLLVLTGLAFVGTAILAGGQAGWAERSWELSGPDHAEPFSLEVVLDPRSGTIEAPGADAGSFAGRTPAEIIITGYSGDGPVALTVQRQGDPQILFADRAGPASWFDLSAIGQTTLTIVATADPPWVAAPGGPVLIRLSFTAGSDNAEPARIGVIHDQALGAVDDVAAADSGQPDSCAVVLAELPIELAPGEGVSCTYLLEVAGEPGQAVFSEAWITTPNREEPVPAPWLGIPIADPDAPPPADTAGQDPDPSGGIRSEGTDVVAVGETHHDPFVLDGVEPYLLRIEAPEGSRDFLLDLRWLEQGLPMGQILAIGWVTAGIVGLLAAVTRTPPTLRRVVAGVLGLAGLSVPATLWLSAERAGLLVVGGIHDWYLTELFLVLAAVSLLLLTLGLMAAAAGVRRRAVRVAGLAGLLLGICAGAVALTIGMDSSMSPWRPGLVTFGDYWVLPVHITCLVAAAALLAAGALLHGMRPIGGKRNLSAKEGQPPERAEPENVAPVA